MYCWKDVANYVFLQASDFICQIKSKRGEVSSVVLEEDSTSDSVSCSYFYVIYELYVRDVIFDK